jgi:drug/metabolite transporter (DMT)-like permease
VPGVALALVLLSAVLHAAWNFLVKRAGAAGAPFTWLFTATSAVLLAPVAVWLVARDHAAVSGAGLLFLAGSAALHTVYFVLLQRGYRSSDLSLVYPLARGTGPLLATVAAVVLLGERPPPLALAGAVLITGGAFVLTGGPRVLRDAGSRAAVANGLAVGAFIGAYTVWDAHLVSRLAMPPLVLEWALSAAIAALLTPVVAREPALLRTVWREHRGSVLVGAVLSSASYILFLTALTLAPVSRVAPAREISIVIGAALGTQLLAEADGRRRVGASGAIAAGVILLALA